jgi:phosphate transport system substrate-binding protein
MHHAAALVLVLMVPTLACTAASTDDTARHKSSRREAVRITGSDTMVNLIQAWAERYQAVRPAISVQVAGGGSGVGFAGLLDGTIDIAAASREIKPAEGDALRRRMGHEPRQVVVARDGLAVYVARGNPLESISLDQLAEIFGEDGGIVRWSALGIQAPGCRSDQLIRVGRQNNSGTFAYFRDVVLGRDREYRMGSIDQSGSKDVVALVATTPCAMGYSGMAFATPHVRMLPVSRHPGAPPIAATEATVADGSYPFARPLYLYTAEPSTDAVRAFVDWTLSEEGQTIVHEIGFVRAPPIGAGGR